MSDANDTIEDFHIAALISGGKGLRAVRPCAEKESSVMTLDGVDKGTELHNSLVFSAVKAFVIEEVDGNMGND